MAAYEVLLLNTAVPQIQAAQSGDTYVVPRDIAFSAVANLANGTYLLPALAFSSDPDTGIFRQGANALGFTAGGGADQMVLTTTGLGIGTNNPAWKLDVAAPLAVSHLASTTGTNPVYMYTTNTGGDFYVGRDNSTGSTFGSNTAYTAVLWSAGAYPMAFFTDGIERMRLDSSGNLGLGVTPSAWDTGAYIVQQNSIFAFASGTSEGNVLHNAFYNGGTWKYITTNFATRYAQNSGQHRWYNAPSGTANSTTIVINNQYTIVTAGGNFTDFGAANNNVGTVFTATSSGTASGGAATQTIVFTQAMTLDASGNLLVGATNAVGRFTLENAATTTEITLRSTGGVGTNNRARIIGGYEAGGSDYGGYLAFNTTTSANVNTERARITSGGYFKASDNGTYNNAAGLYHELYQSTVETATVISAVNASFANNILNLTAARNTTNNSFYALSYYNSGAGAYKLRVADSGDVTNTNGTYGTISDAKMKTDIVDAGSQWSDIKALRFRKFKMKDDPSNLVQLGVVAQEVEQTSPGLVDEHADKDAEGNDLGTTTKSVKTSVLLMKAAVALQEAMTRIEQLEAKVAALQGA